MHGLYTCIATSRLSGLTDITQCIMYRINTVSYLIYFQVPFSDQLSTVKILSPAMPQEHTDCHGTVT